MCARIANRLRSVWGTGSAVHETRMRFDPCYDSGSSESLVFDRDTNLEHGVAYPPASGKFMEAQGKKRSLLRDLALIYIALAHSTDQDLSQPEVDTISARLRAWQTHATEETVLSAIKDALEEYTHERAHDGIEQAVRRVRDELDDEMRQMIVDDLTDIALSDDKFLYAEGSFIGDLARAWNVRITEEPESGSWSVLNGNGIGNGWTSVHDLALVYLYLAHGTDKDIDDAEVDAIANKIGEWLPDADEEQVVSIVHEAMHAYVQGPDKRIFDDSIASLRKNVPTHQRTALLADLNYVADADGGISEAEQKLIDRLANAWNVELSKET